MISIQHPAVLTTERLILKAINPPLFHKLFSELSKNEFINYLGLEESEFEHHSKMHDKGMETHRLSLYYFLLTDKVTGKTIGDCGFHTWNSYHSRAELFYNMRNKDFRQKGLMTEALEKVIAFGFEELKLNRLAAMAGKFNEPSIRILNHFGFTFEGTSRQDYNIDGKYDDSELYSLLKQEWAVRGN